MHADRPKRGQRRLAYFTNDDAGGAQPPFAHSFSVPAGSDLTPFDGALARGAALYAVRAAAA